MIASGDGLQISRLTLDPGHDRPNPRQPRRREAVTDRDRNGQRQTWSEQRQPPAFLQLLVVAGSHVLNTEDQLITKAPHLVAPTALDAAKRQPGKVRMLLLEQTAQELLGDLSHDIGC